MLQPGTLFDNRYELIRMIGRGGFAEVWLVKARDRIIIFAAELIRVRFLLLMVCTIMSGIWLVTKEKLYTLMLNL